MLQNMPVEPLAGSPFVNRQLSLIEIRSRGESAANAPHALMNKKTKQKNHAADAKTF
jgi:hypothetical protein